MRRLIHLLFALVLAVTSVTSAVMHSEMQGGTDLVICSDSASGTVVLTLDPLGNSLPRAHRCPDCLTAHGADLPMTAAVQVAPDSRARLLDRPAAIRSVGLAPPAAMARSPPAFA